MKKDEKDTETIADSVFAVIRTNKKTGKKRVTLGFTKDNTVYHGTLWFGTKEIGEMFDPQVFAGPC